MLFNKDLKIEQAMYRLYEQIQQKELYLFCLNNNQKDKAKYIRLQPGPTIEQIFNRYGKNDYLLLIYADSEVGMQGLKKMEKCMMWVLGILATIWIVLYGTSYYMSWQLESAGQTQPSQSLPEK